MDMRCGEPASSSEEHTVTDMQRAEPAYDPLARYIRKQEVFTNYFEYKVSPHVRRTSTFLYNCSASGVPCCGLVDRTAHRS